MATTSTHEKYVTFQIAERERYEGEDNNRVTFSMGQVSRYLRFLQLAKDRYDKTNAEMVERSRQKFAKLMEGPDGDRELTEEEWADHE